MPAKRVSMRKIRDVLRLRFAGQLSIREIHRSTQMSTGAVQGLLAKAAKLNLTWPLEPDLNDNQLEALLYPPPDTPPPGRPVVPDWSIAHQELKRKGMTKQLLWEEYRQQHPDHHYRYSRYCDLYRAWVQLQKRSMRQVHRAGEKCFIDYSGVTMPIVSATTGEVREAQIFVAVLGASNYTFAEATYSQSLPDWLGSHVRAFEFFGGVPELLIPDNLKSAVNKACRYDPDINASYQQLAEHYEVAVMPARPYKPKDKSKAEVGVQIIERWILMRLRRHTFFSLAELNQCITLLLEELNQKPFKQLPGNRREAFEQLDRPALKPLPRHAYRYVAIKPVKVNIDYHVQYEQHHYSVPHQYVGERLELHASDTLVTAYFRQQSVASHPRKRYPGTTTDPAHMPERHQKHQQWTPGRLKNWAGDIGPATLAWVSADLDARKHPEQGYRACLGLLSLSREYGSDRLERACVIAKQKGLSAIKQIKSLLKSNQDRLPEQADLSIDLPQDHENIRGPHNFH